MKRVLPIVAMVVLALLLAGCGSEAEVTVERVVIGDYDLPVYPGAAADQVLETNASYTTGDGVEEVKAWYDRVMADEGWQTNQQWNGSGGQQEQKIFFQGDRKDNPDYGERNVIIGVGTTGGGATLISLMPILNPYRGPAG